MTSPIIQRYLAFKHSFINYDVKAVKKIDITLDVVDMIVCSFEPMVSMIKVPLEKGIPWELHKWTPLIEDDVKHEYMMIHQVD